jgi:hypothetical protein
VGIWYASGVVCHQLWVASSVWRSRKSSCIIGCSRFTDDSGTSICNIDYCATNFRRFPGAFVSSTQYKFIGKLTIDAVEGSCYESTWGVVHASSWLCKLLSNNVSKLPTIGKLYTDEF